MFAKKTFAPFNKDAAQCVSLGICAHADKMRVLSVLTINLQSQSAEEATNIGDGYNGVLFQFFRVSYTPWIFRKSQDHHLCLGGAFLPAYDTSF